MSEPDWTTNKVAAGGMGNTVLYRMVKDYPGHTCPDIVRDKMMIIGRVYSAAVTRGVGERGGEIEAAIDLYDHLAQHIVSVGCELDKQIDSLRHLGRLDLSNLRSVIEAHSFLNGVISDSIRGWRGRDGDHDRERPARYSFVSKYLHFHAPMSFFIYDSVVSATLRKLRNPRARAPWPRDLEKQYRTPYGKHCVHMLSCAEAYYSGIQWTPRLIDGHLMGYIKDKRIPCAIRKARDERDQDDQARAAKRRADKTRNKSAGE